MRSTARSCSLALLLLVTVSGDAQALRPPPTNPWIGASLVTSLSEQGSLADKVDFAGHVKLARLNIPKLTYDRSTDSSTKPACVGTIVGNLSTLADLKGDSLKTQAQALLASPKGISLGIALAWQRGRGTSGVEHIFYPYIGWRVNGVDTGTGKTTLIHQADFAFGWEADMHWVEGADDRPATLSIEPHLRLFSSPDSLTRILRGDKRALLSTDVTLIVPLPLLGKGLALLGEGYFSHQGLPHAGRVGLIAMPELKTK